MAATRGATGILGNRGREVGRLAALALCLQLACPVLAQAGSVVFRYIDDRGVVHFSKSPIDERFKAVVLRPRGLSLTARRSSKLPLNHGYDDLILRVAGEQRLEPALVKAVIAAESNFNKVAVSRAGAQGLMQLMPETAAKLGVTDPFHAEQNVDAGGRYLRAMLDRYGDLERALAAYNAGPTAVDRYRGIPPYRETEAYVKRVLNYYRGYRGDFHR
jgi:soluble lytic murein transglycosylase-like protein